MNSRDDRDLVILGQLPLMHGIRVVPNKNPNLIQDRCPRFSEGDPTNWLHELKLYCDYNNVRPQEYLILAALHLDKPASCWYQATLKEHPALTFTLFVDFLLKRFGPPIRTNNVWYDLEECQQRMLKSLDNFEENMKRNINNQFQRLIADTQRQFAELRQSSMTKLVAYKRKNEEALDRVFQKFDELELAMSIEDDQDSSSINLEKDEQETTNEGNILAEQLPTTVTSSPKLNLDVHRTILEVSNMNTKLSMPDNQVFMLPCKTANNKNDYEVDCGVTYSEYYALNPISMRGPTKSALNDQRTLIILVFDPGGIKVIFDVIENCIAI